MSTKGTTEHNKYTFLCHLEFVMSLQKAPSLFPSSDEVFEGDFTIGDHESELLHSCFMIMHEFVSYYLMLNSWTP